MTKNGLPNSVPPYWPFSKTPIAAQVCQCWKEEWMASTDKQQAVSRTPQKKTSNAINFFSKVTHLSKLTMLFKNRVSNYRSAYQRRVCQIKPMLSLVKLDVTSADAPACA